MLIAAIDARRSRSLVVLVAVAVAALVSACATAAPDESTQPLAAPVIGSAPPGSTIVSGTVPATLPPAPTSEPPRPDVGAPGGCGHRTDGYVDVAAGRRALVRGVGDAQPTAAVVVLHGFTGTPERIEQTSGWTVFLASRHVLVAYPEGTAAWGGGFGWNTGTHRFSTKGVDDIDDLVSLVRTLVQHECVDPARLMITGESNGGAMTLLAACDGRTRQLFAFFAPVIPAIDEGALERCAAGPALSFVALAGKHDGTIPYDGVYPAGVTPLLAQEAWFAQVAAARNGCATALTHAAIDDAEVLTPTGCADPPSLVAIDDGTHTWPGGAALPGGPAPGRFPATEYLWAHSPLH